MRLSSYFPFDVHVVLNGRDWLARQLDAKDIGYLRQDNCFVDIADFSLAQKLADQQPRIDWVGQLNRLLRRVPRSTRSSSRSDRGGLLLDNRPNRMGHRSAVSQQ